MVIEGRHVRQWVHLNEVTFHCSQFAFAVLAITKAIVLVELIFRINEGT